MRDRFAVVVAEVVGQGIGLVGACEMVLEGLVFADGVPQLVLADWFEQVVDAAVFECLGQVFVVGGREYDGAGDLAGLEYVEGKSV
ncbi:hypothetical protein ACQ86N_06255 [Puia sp. P3]|uniref:hypothetical protein n=1 Tax=Puia sp. P3 TaxID=3423952 RepID=UPI003D672F20